MHSPDCPSCARHPLIRSSLPHSLVTPSFALWPFIRHTPIGPSFARQLLIRPEAPHSPVDFPCLRRLAVGGYPLGPGASQLLQPIRMLTQLTRLDLFDLPAVTDHFLDALFGNMARARAESAFS